MENDATPRATLGSTNWSQSQSSPSIIKVVGYIILIQIHGGSKIFKTFKTLQQQQKYIDTYTYLCILCTVFDEYLHQNHMTLLQQLVLWLLEWSLLEW